MAESRFNTSKPAVRRILQEMREMEADDSLDFTAKPFEENIFEWHFVIRGPPDTEFEGGLYHGQIILPSDYPFKPPSFKMLTKNGRFETNKNICLSISDYHPEHWQPSWSIRTALTALVGFMPTPGKGAIGSMDLSKEVRRKLARESRNVRIDFGNEERTKLATELHEKLLSRMNPSFTPNSSASTNKDQSGREICKPCREKKQPALDWLMSAIGYIAGFFVVLILLNFLKKSNMPDLEFSN